MNMVKLTVAGLVLGAFAASSWAVPTISGNFNIRKPTPMERNNADPATLWKVGKLAHHEAVFQNSKGKLNTCHRLPDGTCNGVMKLHTVPLK